MYIQSQRNQGRSHFRLIAGGFFSVALVFVLIVWRAPHFFPAIFTTIARPFWRMEFSVSEGSLRSSEYLLNENEELKRQLADVAVRSQSASILQSENEDLKALLGRPIRSGSASSASSSAQAIATTTTASSTAATSRTEVLKISHLMSGLTLAAVLVRPPFAAYDELIIDLGSTEGVQVGQSVYAPGNVLIGHVIDVLRDTSKVSLTSSSGSTVNVQIGAKAIPAEAHGKGGGQYSADISRENTVVAGDVVTVPSLHNVIVGTVESVITDATLPFETVLFAPPVNLYGMKWVFVDTHSKVTQ